MATLNGILTAASSALMADQAALTTTGENISNQNAAGYRRRAVTFDEGDTVTIGGSTAGTGVTETSSAVRDAILQRTVEQATQTSSASGTRSTALDNLQRLFAIGSSGSDASGIGPAITSFFNAASSLGASPTDSTAQQTMYTAAQVLASALNRTATQITAQTSSLNQQVSSSIALVNGLTVQVASLNQQIVGATAGDSLDTLLDERDQLVTQISGLVDVNTVTSSNSTIGLTLSDGTPLVSGSKALALTTGTVSGATHIYAASAAGGADVTAAIHGGSIGGSLQARDQDLPATTSQLDTIAQAIVIAVNTQNAAGVTTSGAVGGAIFSGTTAATITVSAPNASAIAVSSTSAGDGNNALALGNLQNAALVNGETLSTSFASLLTGLGQTASAASAASTADASLLSQSSTQLDALSGISLDQEAANLTQYQRSYEAAAKVLSIVNDLMAQAINLGEPTTVT
jgi:flagellar hook-associated protein 1 FlgK